MDSVTDRNKKISFTITLSRDGIFLFVTHATAFMLGGIVISSWKGVM